MDKIGYVYDKSGSFWDKPLTLIQLRQMDDSNHPDIRYIRHNLYSKKIHSDNNRLIFVNSENPHFRRWKLSEAERNGFSSVCETKLHRACKLGIANAKQIRIRINGKDYVISRKWADVETTYQFLGNMYETDCEYAIANIDSELQTILGGDILYIEVHHKSKVKPDKIMSYRICGINVLEFDIETKYLPYDVRTERMEE